MAYLYTCSSKAGMEGIACYCSCMAADENRYIITCNAAGKFDRITWTHPSIMVHLLNSTSDKRHTHDEIYPAHMYSTHIAYGMHGEYYVYACDGILLHVLRKQGFTIYDIALYLTWYYLAFQVCRCRSVHG